jgi:hypothetical protein
MDIKSAFTVKYRESVLENCVYGEEAAQKAYEIALASHAEIPAEFRKLLIAKQKHLNSEK